MHTCGTSAARCCGHLCLTCASPPPHLLPYKFSHTLHTHMNGPLSHAPPPSSRGAANLGVAQAPPSVGSVRARWDTLKSRGHVAHHVDGTSVFTVAGRSDATSSRAGPPTSVAMYRSDPPRVVGAWPCRHQKWFGSGRGKRGRLCLASPQSRGVLGP